jgi:hypothetical protein
MTNLNADQMDGTDSTAFVQTSSNPFVRNDIYKLESAVDAGTVLGDGTFSAGQACNPGDVLLSGGPANVNATNRVLESFPPPGTTNSWNARINKNGATDNWNVVVLCADKRERARVIVGLGRPGCRPSQRSQNVGLYKSKKFDGGRKYTVKIEADDGQRSRTEGWKFKGKK